MRQEAKSPLTVADSDVPQPSKRAKLCTIEKPSLYPDLNLLIGGAVNVKQITEHWDELLRLTASLRLGTVTASTWLCGHLWNTLELARAIEELQGEGVAMTSEQLRHLSPMDWEHIGLTGDYTWDFTLKYTRP